MLDSHQRGIHEALSGMEHEAARLAREESALQDDATRYASGCCVRVGGGQTCTWIGLPTRGQTMPNMCLGCLNARS